MVDDPLALRWWKTARLADCTWLAPAAGEASHTASRYKVIESTDTRDDVEICRALVEERGMEFLVLDPDPARHRHARGASDRSGHAALLGEVSLPGGSMTFRFAWAIASNPLAEADLNPAPVIA